MAELTEGQKSALNRTQMMLDWFLGYAQRQAARALSSKSE
jgi:hypothetical protein